MRTAEDAYWENLYGRWQPMQLPDVQALMSGFSRPWWVVGGWSIDLFTGTTRTHSDVDMSILSDDVPHLRDFLADRWHLWNLHKGDMRPLHTDRTPIFAPDSQLWLRENGDAPWVVDIPLTPTTDGRWTNKFLPTHVAPVPEVTLESHDGVRYLQPQITLFFKARTQRAKDEADLSRALPRLSAPQLAWLADAIATAWGPEHPWLTKLHEA